MIGAARRALSAFVMTLTYSRMALPALLPGPVAGELPARPRVRLRGPSRGRPATCSTTTCARRCSTRHGGRRALQPASARAGVSLPLLAPGLSACARATRREPSSGACATCATRSSRRARSRTLEDLNRQALVVARRSRRAAALARGRPQDGGRGLRGGGRAAAAAARPSLRDRPGHSRPLAQDDLRPLRPQRLLDPARRRRPSADAGRFRDHGAHPGRQRRGRAPPPQLRPPPARSTTRPTSRRCSPRSSGRVGSTPVRAPDRRRARPPRRFLEAAFQRGESVAATTEKLLLLLDDYGAAELRAAVDEALAQADPAHRLGRLHPRQAPASRAATGPPCPSTSLAVPISRTSTSNPMPRRPTMSSLAATTTTNATDLADRLLKVGLQAIAALARRLPGPRHQGPLVPRADPGGDRPAGRDREDPAQPAEPAATSPHRTLQAHRRLRLELAQEDRARPDRARAHPRIHPRGPQPRPASAPTAWARP